MIDALQSDMLRRPELFDISGMVVCANPETYELLSKLPGDIAVFLAMLGGGSIFETEELFAVLPQNGAVVLGLDEGNKSLRSQGYPGDVVYFHQGHVVSGVRDRRIYVYDGECSVVGAYESLSDWYCSVIRGEYACRYGLA